MPSLQGIGILWFLLFGIFSLGVNGLQCLSCSRAWTVKECRQKDPETCGWGKICYANIERGGYGGTRYTLGCMEDARCYGLESLNNRKICDKEPSTCIYCCAEDLCNTAVTSFPARYIFIILASFVVFTLY